MSTEKTRSRPTRGKRVGAMVAYGRDQHRLSGGGGGGGGALTAIVAATAKTNEVEVAAILSLVDEDGGKGDEKLMLGNDRRFKPASGEDNVDGDDGGGSVRRGKSKPTSDGRRTRR